MRIGWRFLVAALGIAAVPNFADAQTAPALSCHGKQKPGKVAGKLPFGRDIGGRLGVSDPAWRRFVAREITPRFPDGLTVTDATGQWRDRSSGRIVREPSKRVEIVLPGRDDAKPAYRPSSTAYKRQFHQQSVGLIVLSPACVSILALPPEALISVGVAARFARLARAARPATRRDLRSSNVVPSFNSKQ